MFPPLSEVTRAEPRCIVVVVVVIIIIFIIMIVIMSLSPSDQRELSFVFLLRVYVFSEGPRLPRAFILKPSRFLAAVSGLQSARVS